MTAPFRIPKPRFLAFFAFESALILAVLYGLATLNINWLASPSDAPLQLTVLLTGGLFFAILLATQSAVFEMQGSLAQELALFSTLSVLAGVVLFLALLMTSADPRWPPTLLAIEGAVAVPLAVAVWRWASVRWNVVAIDRERVLIVGTGETARQICRWIVSNRPAEYSVLGFAAEDHTRVGTLLAMGARIQTDYASLPRFVGNRVDRIIVALDEKRGKLPVQELMEVRISGVEVEDGTSFLERTSGRISVETMLPSWLIYSEGFKVSTTRTFLKRVTDLSHSIVLLIVSAPIMLLTAVLVKLESRGPVLYRQARLGRYGEEFQVLKFRSMRQDAEKKSGPTWAQENDPRVTRVGRIIRKLRIDELPQLINVLRGEMSFVGPRPERAHFVRQLEEKIPYFGLRMTMRPGITGWAQVEHGYGASDEDALEKLKYDLFYIKNNNLLLDLLIVLKTIKVVLLGSGAR